MAGTNTALIAAGKPNYDVSGGVLIAPLGSTRPTDASTPLDAAYVPVGYVSEDGVTETTDRSTDKVKAWGGRNVKTLQTEYGVSVQFGMYESLNATVLKAVFGEDNVTVAAGGVTVKRNEQTLPHMQIVVDMLNEGLGRRLDIGNGQITEVDDISYVDGEVITYTVTVSCDPDEDGNSLIEYIETAADDSGDESGE